MEERNEAISPNDGGSCPASEIPRVSSGLHSEDSVIAIPESTELQSDAVSESVSNEPEIGQSVNAVITPEGVQELPPWLIGSDGKPLPINERTLRLIRGKTFTVRHILLEDCQHKMDMQNQPKTGCENCWYQWLNHHGTLVQTAHEFYQQFGKERLVSLRGRVFTKMFLRFMSTVAHMIEEQKAQEAANGNDSEGTVGVQSEVRIEREGIPVEAADSGRESQTGEISNNPA
jgi:hypothetical protein